MPEVSLNLWYEALGTPFGIVILTNNPERCRQRLYKLRDAAGDPVLSTISVVTSPTVPESHVWLVKRKQDGQQ